MNQFRTLVVRLILVGAILQTTPLLADDDSLHNLIDKHLQPISGFKPLKSSDAEFLRRVCLDLTGRPPTADEARKFLADQTPDKRERLIDGLLGSPQYARHLASTLDLMLMERRPNTHVSADDWQAWLYKSVKENKPWNLLAREILSADGDDPALRPAARFALDRASESNLLTLDISRIFFGKDIQCAQCHDHPLIDDYLQSDYQGLLAFVSPGFAFVKKEGDKQITMHAERAGSELSFESVFLKGESHRTGPRLPDGITIDEPFFLPGEEYTVAQADNVKPVPKFSRRAKLAELATNGTNRAFNENIANRLWAHMFGRGLVHPVDLHHAANPASHPQLLRSLGERFATMNYDLKGFIREIALSEAYQRDFDAPADLAAYSSQATAIAAQLEQQRPALEAAAKATDEAYAQAMKAWHQAESKFLPIAGELDAARNKYAESKRKADEAAAALASATTQFQAKQSVAAEMEKALTSAQKAATALPEDKELAGAVQLLSTRSQTLSAEATALAKVVEEKTAAQKPLVESLATEKSTVEATLAKLAPAKTAMNQAEHAMLEARRKASIDAQALAAFDKQLETTRRIAKRQEIAQAITAAQGTHTLRTQELATAEKQLADYTSVVAQHQANVKTATETMTRATNALTVAQTEHTKRTELATAIDSALKASEAAAMKAGADPVLTEVVVKLKDRSTLAKTQLGESQQQVTTQSANQKTVADALGAVQKMLADATAEQTRREQVVNTAKASVATAANEIAAKQSEMQTSLEELTHRLANDFTLATLKPLTPEQICWSVFRVTGVYDRYWQAEVAELDKTKPLTDEQKQDPAQLAARAVELEQRTFDKLKGNLGTFVAFYGAGAGQPQGDFFATADQALFAANGGSINSWVAPTSDNVTERIIKQTDPRIAAEELYLGVLSRMPTDEEITEVTNHLANRAADKPVAAQELVWALLNSAEFRFNH